MKDVRTWIEIDKQTLHHNVEQFLSLVPKGTRFMAVVKSNAYGHGLWHIARSLAKNKKIWFGVDSMVEGARLREEGIKNPILVLGATLPSRLAEAAAKNIAVTVSTFELLTAIAKSKKRPAFHIKIDTGMHRHGFLMSHIPWLIQRIKLFNLKPEGLFTHFATANDMSHAAFTKKQFKAFQSVVVEFKKLGFQEIICHTASTGGTLHYPNTRLDMIRIGMGIFGYLPSRRNAKRHVPKVTLKPVLTWKTIVMEVKEIPKGSFVGYDITERVRRKTKIAIMPVGYWHGFDRGFSRIGEVLIRGRRAKVLGRVSMDIIVVDATNIPRVRVGDEVVLIGNQGQEVIRADEISLLIGTTHYEVLTRINPLIRRTVA